MTDEISDEEAVWLNTLFQAVAYRVAGQQRFRGHVEADDLFQRAWEWMLTNRRRYLKWEKESSDDVENLERRVIAVITNELTAFARGERAHHLGYKPSDEFFYDRGMLEELVKAVHDDEAWTNPPKPEDTSRRNAKAPNEGNGWVATLSDVSSALQKLEQDDRKILYWRHSEEMSTSALADMFSLSERQVYHRLERAIKRLWSQLGGPQWLTPKDVKAVSSGRRRAMSNAHARAITSNDWNPQ